ncbi:MAG: hypothetical protein HYR96_04980 [Deltaproteobacteria bacterium]|nr:hypothetical protein [Deltaproteobacteria bacterium]MBI3294558.1 hypothetical protein [Deltaproteobacteria bacterium]
MKKGLFALMAGIVCFGAGSAHADLKKWNKRMQELSRVLSDLLPEITNEKSDPKKLKEGTAKLSELVHGLKLQPGKESLLPPDADPSLTMISDTFEREVERAQSAIREGYIQYGKGILRNATSYCIACHTRSNSGPDFPGITLTTRTEKMPALQKAEILAATRQFDGALEEFMKVVSDDKAARLRQLEWRRAVQRGLLLATRVKQDPDKTLRIVNAIASQTGPLFLKEYTGSWRDAIVKWKAEPSSPKRTEESLFAEANRLYSEGIKAQRFALDHAGDIYFLRATAAAHDQLRVSPTGPKSAEAMLLIGQCYEVVNDPVLWPIHETYYENCIRQAPHTAVAAKCYGRFEESIYFGYSGSGGISIPDDIQAHLSTLRNLAHSDAEKR